MIFEPLLAEWITWCLGKIYVKKNEEAKVDPIVSEMTGQHNSYHSAVCLSQREQFPEEDYVYAAKHCIQCVSGLGSDPIDTCHHQPDHGHHS